MKFRRSPCVVSFWQHGNLLFHNFATGARILGSPVVCDLLDRFDRWRTVASVVDRFPSAEASIAAKLARELARRSFLDRSDHVQTRSSRSLKRWSDWNPEAGLFHFSTKDASYETDVAAAERRQRQNARRHPMPSPIRSFPHTTRQRLPEARLDGELPRVLLERRTWRHFSPAPLDLSALATLLRLTWGVQRWAHVRGQGRVALKTSPSGGARHPIEAYVLATRVSDLRPGLYHYAAHRHDLERIRTGGSARQIVRYCANQAWYGSAGVIVIMTAVFAREQWRYPFARAYRAVLLDAGHLCQTFCLVATWLGLAPFCTMALADSLIERDLGIDGVSESVIYVAGAGSRPVTGWSQRQQRAALRQ